MQIMLAVIGGLLGGSAVAALITQVGEGVRQRRRRRYDTTDQSASDMAALKAGLKWVLYDRIRYLGQAYLREGEIDFDDRRLLGEMHKSYHDGLGGNGDLDTLMQAVSDLPLKR